MNPYLAIIFAATELAPYPPKEKPGLGVAWVGIATGGGDGVSTISDGGGAIATPAARFVISSASSSSGCYQKY